MKTLRSISTLILLFFSLIAFTQNFKVPQNVEYKTAKDYEKYEKDIIAASKWLVATPLDEQEKKRQEVSAFVFQWVSGSPTVSITLHGAIADLSKKNSGMMFIYIASYCRYILENNYSTDILAAKKAAIDDMIKVYESGKGVNKDKKMLKLIKAKNDGKLDQWIAKNLPD